MKEIPLVNGHGVALVDDDDFDRLSRYRWYFKKGYAYRAMRVAGKQVNVYMHREIVAAPAGFDVDHSNNNGLDNQRSNLRVCAHRLNQANQRRRKVGMTSRFKGVHWCKALGKWAAQITIDGRGKHLGYFVAEGDAARAYDSAAITQWGEYARPNLTEAAT